MKYLPKDATIAVTYKCNSRCRMCNIWQIENAPDLPIEALENLSPSLRYINLSGGEPFLRPDLSEIVEKVKEKSPKAQIIISSNGFATGLISDSMKKIIKIDPKIGVRISLDGIGETHDQVRGLPGIFKNVLATVGKLKEIGVKNLGFSFTIMDFNVDQLIPVYEMSKKMDVQLALALVQNSEIYFKKGDNTVDSIEKVEKALSQVISEELASRNMKKWLRAYYDYGLLYFAKYKKRLLPSGAGFDSMFIDPNGIVYPSNLINLEIGNLEDGGLGQTWNSVEAENARQEIKDKKLTESWIICTIRGEMKKNILKIGFWILKNKLFGFKV